MSRLLLAVLLAATASSAEARRRSDVVVDTCQAEGSWVAYRTAFNAAIARRDARALLRLVANDISFGGNGNGRAAFARHWGLARPASSRLWPALAKIMSLGCARDRRRLHWVPSIFLDEDAPDDATYGPQAVVIGNGVILRAAPSGSARVIARMSWDIVFLPERDHGRGSWVHATLDNDREGFVRRNQLQSLTGPYALFENRRGTWRLAFLGDRD